jgi:PAS domain S-box-containing protein
MSNADNCFEDARKIIADDSKLLYNIMDAMGDGLSIQDRNLRIVYQNKFMIDHFGSHIGDYCYNIYESRNMTCDGCPIVEAFRTGKVTRALRVGITKDGTPFRFENTASPLRNDRGEIVAGMELCRIVEDREKALDDLRIAQSRALQQEELLRATIEAAPTAIIGLDPDGNVHSIWNRAAERMLGWSAREVMGRPLPTVPKEKEEEFRHFREQIRNGMTLNGVEVCRKKRDGTPIDYSIYASPLHDAEDNIFGNIAVLVDITKRKVLEDQLRRKNEDLERSNAELKRFAHIASHHLQEPLRKVGSYLELLAERYHDKLDRDAHDFIEYAVDGAQRMKDLINVLLIYSRIDIRRKSFEPIESEAVLKKVLMALEPVIKDANAIVRHSKMPVVAADESQLEQLFLNLIHNAVKYRNQNPVVVKISAEKTGEAWRFSIQDNGIGIEPRFQTRIFEMFQRLHGNGEYGGTGIGLSICKKIVERHSGTIGVESAPGQGSTFYFTIPDRKEGI